MMDYSSITSHPYPFLQRTDRTDQRLKQ
ncbi:hypothetical protein CCUS01_04440 [Colletotrichum cuscutae]|uniref:Uncharacterized protein n=1 Tax=Colletotrichum cuscutae TaxID=1209917 RepID=A0AAI9VFB3_9PEZI|nr:hypothetical protein CCUS01_04440 [Colletotrichum cuscutae]